MDANHTRIDEQMRELREELRALRTDVERLRSTLVQMGNDTSEAQRAAGSASATTKFAWLAPLIRRIENLERKTGTQPPV
jgi:predicted  nucleic acid-binding Zn-ribbon protein